MLVRIGLVVAFFKTVEQIIYANFQPSASPYLVAIERYIVHYCQLHKYIVYRVLQECTSHKDLENWNSKTVS